MYRHYILNNLILESEHRLEKSTFWDQSSPGEQQQPELVLHISAPRWAEAGTAGQSKPA